MSKFYNTSRGSVSATIGGVVAVFAPKQWTELDDGIELSASLKSLLDQGVLIPGAHHVVSAVARASKPRDVEAPKKDSKIKVEAAPAKVEAKPEAAPKAKEDRPLLSSDKK